MPKLVFTDRNFAGKIYPLTLERTTIGRGDGNILVIRDASLSAHHCEILVNGPEVIVRDLGSRNGTMVGRQLLKNQQSSAKNGQTIRFGLVDARLEIENKEWNDDTSPESAVFDHRQAMLDQRRAQKTPPPGDPAMKLRPNATNAGDEMEPKTILMPAPVPIAPTTVPSQAPGGDHSSGPPVRGLMLLWLAVAIAALLLATWILWGRK
jgi:predicted component of type VI protein secretion system